MEDVTSNIVTVIAHVEDAIAHIENVTNLIDDVKAHIAPSQNA